ncbi:hypothetical protein L207DRAFT_512321 [Hyaloscypha variabilis F]|uniref:Uncharacterized protein n=1 Tax=Hyaloscypha variabilis (strain UAMH 11265 / GT02V1 / F) TaxID=1149755 RepID=A0A2J6RQV2_HYAVF|nr:hypothetical protein L207DRAFT_512321 [Hyaloscypha variabilis F]
MPVEEKTEAASTSGEGGNYRWGDLMQDLHQLSKLQEDASHAQIDARQKRREASFKRQDVWLRDDELMRHIQELSAQGRFEGFEDLIQLASKCQTARDDLGPVEQEGIEAEQRWEGHLWELQRAEEQIYRDYQNEFEEAATYSQDDQNALSAEDEHQTILEEQVMENAYPNIIPPTPEKSPARSTTSLVPHQLVTLKADQFTALQEDTTTQSDNEPRNAILLDLVESAETNAKLPPTESFLEWDSDSGIADINRIPTTNTIDDLAHSFQKLPNKHFNSLEPYPQLMTDFGTTRDRINKWLENTALVSHFEGISIYTILKDKLEKENASLPTNWAQLVVAYWDLDGASIPRMQRQRKVAEITQSGSEGEANKNSKEKMHTGD